MIFSRICPKHFHTKFWRKKSVEGCPFSKRDRRACKVESGNETNLQGQSRSQTRMSLGTRLPKAGESRSQTSIERPLEAPTPRHTGGSKSPDTF